MKNLSRYLYVCLSIICINSHSQVVEQFQKFYGGSVYEDFRSMVKTNDGGFLFAGNTVSYGAGLYDVYLVKTDANGDSIWTKIYGGANYDIVWTTNCLQQTTDGGYILVAENRNIAGGDFWLIKLTTNGDTTWTKTYGGYSNERPNCLRQTSDGGYIIAGQSWSYGNANDVYIVKADSLGNMQWQQNYSLRTYEDANGIVETPEGDYILSGITYGGGAFWRMKINSTGNVIWYKDELYGGASGVISTSDGNYIILGNTWVAGNGQDVYLIKINTDGDTLWTKTYGGINLDAGNNISITSEGGYLISGNTESFGAGGSDYYLIKIDANGDTLWSKTIGTNLWQRGYAAVETDDGGYMMCGSWDIGGNAKAGIVKLKELVMPTIVTGKIYSDVDSNCVYTHGIDNIIVNRMVKAEPGPYYVFTNDSGDYKLQLPKGDYTVSMSKIQDDPWGYQNCMTDTVYQIHAVGKGEEVGGNDFALKNTTAIICGSEINIDVIPNSVENGTCGLPLTSPCPNFQYEFCINITNTDASPLPLIVNTPFNITLSNGMTINQVNSSEPILFDGLGTNVLTGSTFSPINIGQTLEICIVVDVDANPTLPFQVTTAFGNLPNNLVVNGDFQNGNNGFNTDYTWGCGIGRYRVGMNPFPPFMECNNWNLGGWDHTFGDNSGLYLYADGSPDINDNVWCQNINNLTLGCTYRFNFWANNIQRPTANRIDPNLEVLINGASFIVTGNIPENPDNWLFFSDNWVCNDVNPDICIRTIANPGSGNDFGIDDISLNIADGMVDVYTENDQCSCDPNDKLVSPKGCGEMENISFNTSIEYLIRYENIGTGLAHNIFIKDSIDTDFDLTTLRIIGSSHDISYIEIKPNGILFIYFNNIELASINDPSNNKGYVKFEITPKANLSEGTELLNFAEIYFDNNPPVITNTTINTLRLNPTPDASFEFNRICNSIAIFNFNYSGNTADNAEFLWDFGLNSNIQFSNEQNPTNIEFLTNGTYFISLTINRYGCSQTVMDSVVVQDFACGKDKILICHNNNTICISKNALNAHLAHGDCIGECESNKNKSGILTKDISESDYFEIVPNPAKNNVAFQLRINDNNLPVEVSIYNYLGVIIDKILINSNVNEYNYNLQNIPSGIYTVNCKSQNNNFNKKLLIY